MQVPCVESGSRFTGVLECIFCLCSFFSAESPVGNFGSLC